MSSQRKKIIVSGANGQLAQEIKYLSHDNKDFSFKFLSRQDLDITNRWELERVFQKHDPVYFINCAAYTSVDKAEKEKEKVYAINASGPREIARLCHENGCILVHISTDYVYDNGLQRPLIESDPTFPKGIYAKAKLLGEKELIAAYKKSIIIRTSWIYSSFGNNFVKTISRLMKEKEELKIVNDQKGSPTYARDIADMLINNILKVLTTNQDEFLFGIYNYCNEGVATWYEFAIEIKRIGGYRCKVLPILTKDFKAPAPRPLYSVLNNKKIVISFAIDDIPHWKDSLALCMSEFNN